MPKCGHKIHGSVVCRKTGLCYPFYIIIIIQKKWFAIIRRIGSDKLSRCGSEGWSCSANFAKEKNEIVGFVVGAQHHKEAH